MSWTPPERKAAVPASYLAGGLLDQSCGFVLILGEYKKHPSYCLFDSVTAHSSVLVMGRKPINERAMTSAERHHSATERNHRE
jgi:hypothetical protein